MASNTGGGRKGMGFKAAAKSVAKKSGVPIQEADAVIAAGARKASPAAKKANPALKKVAGAAKKASVKKANPALKKLPSSKKPSAPGGSY